MSYVSEISYKTDMIRAIAYPNSRVPTGQGKSGKFVREKSGYSIKWSGKLENP